MSETYELKKLSADGVSSALEKAQRYRLLGEPQEAESICLDILAVTAPEAITHQQARVTLILALSDQLADDLGHYDQAMRVVGELDGYERAYYEGILCERRAKAHHRSGGPFAGTIAHDWFVQAMACFDRAIASPGRPPSNEDAILRWNTCARLIMRHPELDDSSDDGPVVTLLE